ncbi:MAG: VTC domain-containing protein, partial [bacterium]
MPQEAELTPPPNLHLPASFGGRPSLRERVEQKYFVAPSKAGWALALLRTTCRWDDQYPAEQINSLYFDTPHLDQHERSLAGEFGKDKVRIRWYGDEHDPHRTSSRPERPPAPPASPRVQVWLELKSRRG